MAYANTQGKRKVKNNKTWEYKSESRYTNKNNVNYSCVLTLKGWMEEVLLSMYSPY